MASKKKNSPKSNDDEEELLCGEYNPDSSWAKTITMFIGFHLLYFLLPLAVTWVPVILLIFPPTPIYRVLSVVFLVAYWGHVFTDKRYKKQGAPWPAFENWILFQYFLAWLPIRILRTKKLDPSKLYVFGCHPHGTLAFNRAAAGFCTNSLWFRAFPGVDFRVLAATVVFFVPIIREMWLWSYIVDASKKTAQYVLREVKASVFVYPGGEKEQIETVYQQHRAMLSTRKGFVKLAIEEGAQLVPVYAFGESHLYYHSHFLLGLRKFLVKKFGVAIPLLCGQAGLMPYRVPVTMVFGAPIEVPHKSQPTQEDIDTAHEKYCKALLALFDKYKAQCGYPEGKLEIL
mmetsp:Transcript_25207/g.42003  ORF Transcript_25207/g.42003 Transcript_25207/m.42003 type:complete len:344 (+) Transcript_25207:68-1099(+)|eukprot:CAMPEP_0174989034 /NCGR_PEP_ID=MMETSP0004_2-20121128/20491_1 /TAXON_ID=420556 /ORGANISM="Ochromonas sp., Strain CCMP1393" /LENGTH=343 /DNA_ID=CAMNT_0016242385 /DNA_START=26 /DNA_END=1057 /DNA_ORIENTATION=-